MPPRKINPKKTYKSSSKIGQALGGLNPNNRQTKKIEKVKASGALKGTDYAGSNSAQNVLFASIPSLKRDYLKKTYGVNKMSEVASARRAAHAKARKGRGASLAGETNAAAESPYAEGDVSTTSVLRTQGKAYAYGKEAYGGTAAGATKGVSKANKKEKKGGKGGGGKGGGKKLVKGAGHKKQGVKQGYHVNTQGVAVKNKGKRNK